MIFLSKIWKESVLVFPFGGRKPLTADRSKLIPASAVLKDLYFGRIRWGTRLPRDAAVGDGGPKGGSYKEKEFHFNIATFVVVGAVYYVYNDWNNTQYREAELDNQKSMICELKRNGEYLKMLVAPPAPPAPCGLMQLLCPTRHK